MVRGALNFPSSWREPFARRWVRREVEMLFNTPQFFIFLLAVLACFYAAPRALKRYLLLGASYYFYMSWNPRFIPLLLSLTAIDYAAGLWIARSRRRIFLILSLCANLGFLGFFKYYNFAASNLASLFHQPQGSWALSIILPLGISFHTFQSMSYVIDVYRGEQEPVRNFIDYALFIAFFPQLVAGPIVRAREFFADFYAWKLPEAEERLRGCFLILLGLVKKMALADQFAVVADSYFQNAAAPHHVNASLGWASAWSGAGAFAFQIFFDFSGYSDMAIGMALLFGFHFPENFRRPYLAFSITDFWRRWHMTLSRWLRDYLYIPLGGNRHGKLKTYRNLMLTMLLGGLWHGASWNFAVWGGYHGSLLALERMTGLGEKSSRWFYPFRVVSTFAFVTIGWVFFRARTLGDSWFVIRQMFSPALGGARSLIPMWLLWLAGVALTAAVAEEKWEWIERLPRAPAWVYPTAMVLLLMAVELIGVTEKPVPFVYFQF
jgi:alginate O-acetyltransferase complex protein AlgI